MLNKVWAIDFAKEWIDSWSTLNLERVLSHYAEDFEMNSPFIISFTGKPSGMLS